MELNLEIEAAIQRFLDDQSNLQMYYLNNLAQFDHNEVVHRLAARSLFEKLNALQVVISSISYVRDDTYSLVDLVRYADTDLNLSIGRSTVSRILRDYNMVSHIAPRKLRINPPQRHKRLQ
ncbi:unnamed protein product [Rotaria magnacalcarata]|uniref:Transposase n=1 Tax=Rotaria magnacalcarata TaxID=392030 RepID=A0A815G3C9_9BILA|nr:unnamed protein product [Rotaria magnacalcarata]CAF1471409.1 unnamed protein product [Rotaria magnacalcarata]CAF3911180.1 unnamed protein product [Rotaria magnacalcarata]CAF3912024.1 unnamed protein product [Rotaria magnacalcarata]